MHVLGWGSNLFGQLEQSSRLALGPVHIKGKSLVGVSRSQVVCGGADGMFHVGGYRDDAVASDLPADPPVYVLGDDVLEGAVAQDGSARCGSIFYGEPTALRWRSAASNSHGRIVAIQSWHDASKKGSGGTRIDVPPCVSVAGGGAHFVLACEGPDKVYALGDNRFGQLGNTDLGHEHVVPVALFSSAECFEARIAQVAAGGRHSVALADDGCAYVWGWDSVQECVLEPAPVLFDDEHVDIDVVEVACGAAHTLLCLSDGSVWGTGTGASMLTDDHMELAGSGAAAADQPHPVVTGAGPVRRVLASGWSSFAEVGL